MNKELWKKSVQFHGYECPGLAMGFKACKAAMEKMGLSFSKDEEVVCVTENDACGVDAVQVITGCTFGKGNLIYKGTGKMAFSFFNRTSGESLRMIVKPFKGEIVDYMEKCKNDLDTRTKDIPEDKKRKVIKAKIKEMALVEHRIVLEEEI